MLSIIMLSIIMLSVIMLSVVAPSLSLVPDRWVEQVAAKLLLNFQYLQVWKRHNIQENDTQHNNTT